MGLDMLALGAQTMEQLSVREIMTRADIPFDVMGGGATLTSTLNHFNVRYKRNLDWLTDS